MTLESDQQKYAFVHSAKHVGEIGEAVMINRMPRQEMMEMNKQVQLGSQAAFADVEKQLAAIRMIRQAQKEVLQDLKEMETPAQPQRIDWFPLANYAMQTFSDIGVALVKSLPKSATPQPSPMAAPPPASQVAQSAPAERPPAEERDKPDPPAAPRIFTPRREPEPESKPFALDERVG